VVVVMVVVRHDVVMVTHHGPMVVAHHGVMMVMPRMGPGRAG